MNARLKTYTIRIEKLDFHPIGFSLDLKKLWIYQTPDPDPPIAGNCVESVASAALTSILFTIGKFLIGLYLGNSGVTSAYGAAGSLITILLWVYYSSVIFLLGAEFTQGYASTYGSGVIPAANAESSPAASDRERQSRPPQKRTA